MCIAARGSSCSFCLCMCFCCSTAHLRDDLDADVVHVGCMRLQQLVALGQAVQDLQNLHSRVQRLGQFRHAPCCLCREHLGQC